MSPVRIPLVLPMFHPVSSAFDEHQEQDKRHEKADSRTADAKGPRRHMSKRDVNAPPAALR